MPPTHKTGTEYVVLAQDAPQGDGPWIVLGTFVASSENAAKATALREKKPEGGWVVAVPSRSWKPEDKRPKLTFI